MQKTIFLLFVIIALSGCSNKFDYLPVSEFTISQDAIKNRDTVEVVYWSGGPGYNQNKEYYHQYIVVSKSTKDTIRVLSMPVYDFEHSSREKVFISINSPDETDKMIATQFGVSGEQPDKVLYRTEHPLTLNKNIPTVIGYFAETSSTLVN